MKKAMKIIVNIVKWTLVVALGLMLVFTASALIAKAVTKDEMPSVFGVSAAIVRSGSMSGSIEVGDMVVVKKSDEYSVGDVITFTSGSSYTTHRIVEVTEDGFVTKGDANNTADKGVVSANNIKGKVVSVLPGVGKFTDFVRSPAGIAVMLIVLVAVLALGKIVEAIRAYAARSNEKVEMGGLENA